MENPILDAPDHDPYGGFQPADELHVGLKILSFCIPIAGAIIYFTTNANQFPNKRKQACNFALIGIGVSILLRVLMMAGGGGF